MMESICFYFMWKRTHFHMMESICFYFMWKRTHFPLRDFIGKTGSLKILGKADSLKIIGKQEVYDVIGLSRRNESSDFYCFLGHTIIM